MLEIIDTLEGENMKLIHVGYSGFTSFIRWSARTQTIVLALMCASASVLITATACYQNSNGISSRAPFFPVQKEGLAQMLISEQGKLVLDNDCLRLKPIIGDSYLLIWPYGYSLQIEGKMMQIINEEGKTVARVGDVIKVGGGPAVSAEIAAIYSAQVLPDNCRGPYWLVSEVIDSP